jgi:hypothetical protein
MRRYIFLAILIMLAPGLKAEVLSVDPAATPKPIKVMVEGLPDAKPTSLTTQSEVFFKNELFKPNTINSVAAIRVLANKNQKNTMEAEVVDAIIAKLADMEADARKQKIINIGLVCGMIGLLIALAATRRKK